MYIHNFCTLIHHQHKPWMNELPKPVRTCLSSAAITVPLPSLSNTRSPSMKSSWLPEAFFWLVECKIGRNSSKLILLSPVHIIYKDLCVILFRTAHPFKSLLQKLQSVQNSAAHRNTITSWSHLFWLSYIGFPFITKLFSRSSSCAWLYEEWITLSSRYM